MRHVRSKRSAVLQNAIESLESRYLLASVTVNVGTAIRNVETKLLAVNSAPWDGQMSSATTNTLINAIGINAVRTGGGSYVDDTWHFNVNNQNQTMGQQANFIASRNAVGMITVNYGSGSPQESAALLAYLNGDASSTVTIGMGEQWNGSAWVDVDWKTVGYWASLRAAPTISGNPDGLNFLRLNRAAPYNFHYWDIGNELYGSWEVDHHGHASDHLPMPVGGVRAPHDPTTLVSFAKQFQTLAMQIDPTISMGFDSQNTDPTQFSNWTANVLTQANDSHQDWNIGFVSDHLYMQEPGQENDTTLLAAASSLSNPANPKGWIPRAAKYRALITNNYGPAEGAGVELLSTELNSVSSNPGKQVNSLVNAVYLADSLGTLMQTEYNGAFMWDLHNSLTNGNASTNLYGWRPQGDYGLIGSGGIAPAGGLNTPFPNYFAELIASKIIKPGGTVVQSISNDSSLGAYAVKQSNGHVTLMVINRSKSGLANNTTGTPAINNTTFTFSNFAPSASAQMWQFGSVEDNIAKNSTNGQTALTFTTPTLNVNGASFSMGFPSLSMTVIDLSLGAPVVASTGYEFDTLPNRVRFTFDQDLLESSLAPTDLTLSTLDGVTLPGVQSVSYNAASRTATFTLANLILPDANYTATLPAGSVSSSGNVATNADYSFAFFVLAGDANHDRHADAADQAILSANLNQRGNFSAGDFNGDGTVDSADQAILTNSLNIWLPQDGTLALPSSGAADVVTLRAESSTLLDLYNAPAATGTPAYRIYTFAATALTLDGGAGNDMLVLDYSNGRPFPTGGISFVGGADSDTLAIIGTLNVADTATFAATGISVNGALAIASSGAERITFDGRDGFDNVAITGGPTVNFPATQHLQSLSLGIDASASIDANISGVIVARSLALDPTALLDLNNNSLIVDYTGASQLAATQSQINAARTGGTWIGNGITSSSARNASPRNTTLGAMEASDFKSIYGPGAQFSGESIDTTAVLIKYTYYGDADFNGVVNFDDYGRTDSGFNNGRSGWLNGDFDGNGIVNFDDYSLIDLAFNTQGVAIRAEKSAPSKLSRSRSI